jgi:hypothetical protein
LEKSARADAAKVALDTLKEEKRIKKERAKEEKRLAMTQRVQQDALRKEKRREEKRREEEEKRLQSIKIADLERELGVLKLLVQQQQPAPRASLPPPIRASAIAPSSYPYGRKCSTEGCEQRVLMTNAMSSKKCAGCSRGVQGPPPSSSILLTPPPPQQQQVQDSSKGKAKAKGGDVLKMRIGKPKGRGGA